MNQQQINAQLISEWLKIQKGLEEPQKKRLEEWFLTCEGDTSGLYQIYKDISEENSVRYTIQEIMLLTKKWKEVLSGAIELLCPILPLGSVVDLKKDRMEGQSASVKQAEKVRIVITRRFLSYTDQGYFTYAGIVYPIGVLRGNEVIHFNPLMIQEMIHHGYEDEQELAYLYQMKQEYIIRKNMRSYEFAAKEERKRLITYMEGRNDQRD